MSLGNVLFFGASGTLGRNLTELVGEASTTVKAYVRSDPIKFKSNNIDVESKNISTLSFSDFPQEVDTIIYLAQSRNFRDFPNSADDIMEINTDFPVRLASWAVKNNVRKFLYASSGSVYSNTPGAKKEIFDIDANKENGFYMASKLATEILLRPFSNSFETFLILRPFFMFSEEQEESMLIPRLFNNVKLGKEITIQGDEGLIINPIHSKIAAKAVVKLLEKENYRETVNIAGSDNVSLKEICEIFGSVLNKEPKFKFVDGVCPELIGDNSRMLNQTSIGLDSIRVRLKKFAELKNV